MSTAKSCYIHRVDGSLQSVHLPNNTPVTVGRNADTQVTDLKCSREQVCLCANYENRIVTVQQLGKKSCGFNGAKTMKGEVYVAKHGDELELVYGKLPYRVEFKPPSISRNEVGDVTSAMKKRSSDSSSSSSYKNNHHDECSEDNENKKRRKTSNESENDGSIPSGSRTDAPTLRSNVKLLDGNWKSTDEQSLMIFTSSGVESRNKIACYDMDGTLITTQSGRVFPKDPNDWKILYPSVPSELKKYHSDGYKIVIFTNQGALGLGKLNQSEFKKKIEAVVRRLLVPVQVFIATGRDRYRKPMIGMWEKLINDNNDDINVNLDESFYVGDAAGRPKDWKFKAKKDHSMADRLFAINIGLKFQTPEEHFLGHKPVGFVQPSFDPKTLKTDIDIFVPRGIDNDADMQEVIILVGGPGSGKSYIALTHLMSYIHINRDTLGTWQKCVSAMKEALSNGKSVVVDNTNPDVASRKRFLDVAKDSKVPVRCFVMNTTLEHAKHNNRFRELTDPSHTIVSDIIINSYLKNYVEPSLTEGFDDIVRVNFVPKFNSEDHRQIYEMYLLEK